MRSSRQLTRTERALVREEIEKSVPPGPRRDALLFLHTCGPEAIPRRRDRMEAFLWIDDKETGLPIQWTFNRPQRLVDYIRQRDEQAGVPCRMATLKARQFGVTRYWQGAGVELAVFHPNSRSAIVADKGVTAQKVLDSGNFMVDRLPYKLEMRYRNRMQLHFKPPISSIIDIESAESDQPLRGKTYRFCHCTETAFWKDTQNKVASINQAIPKRPGTVLSHESTANGIEDWWYDFWWAAKKKENSYHALFFPWFFDPQFDYCMAVYPGEAEEILDTLDDEEKWLIREGVQVGQLKWRRDTIRNELFGDMDLFHQEYPAKPEEAFLASGMPAFDSKLLLQARNECKHPTWRGDLIPGTQVGDRLTWREVPSDRGMLRVFERPKEGHVYAIGVDSGEGIQGGDYSCGVVIDVHEARQVATLHGIIPPPEFGPMLAVLGWFYNEAYVLPEVEGPGIATLNFLAQTGYYKVGLRPLFATPGKVKQRKLGWSTNHATKPVLVNEIRAHLGLEGGVHIADAELIPELLSYQRDERGGYSAPKGRHDDRVIAWGISLMARRDMLESGIVDEEELPPPKNFSERHWREYHEALTMGFEDVHEEDEDYL